MARRLLLLGLFVLGAGTAPAGETKHGISAKDDLETASSDSYAKRSPEYTYYGGSGIIGNGIVDGYGGYDNTPGFGSSGTPTRGYYGGGFGTGYAPRDYGYGGGFGGYGGYQGNGGLSSYAGYNNPYYQGSNHLGYGYYNRNLKGYGNIYSNGIAPNLVTGYRGYSRR